MGFLIRDKHQEGFVPIPNWIKRLFGIQIVEPEQEEPTSPVITKRDKGSRPVVIRQLKE